MRGVLSTVLAAMVAVPATARAENDPWFSRDKALHFGVSGLIASNGYFATRLADGNRGLALGIGAGTAIVIGVGKELYDLTGRGDPSWKDLSWDLVGTGTGLLVAWAFDRLVLGEGASSTPHALRIGDWNVAFSLRPIR